VVYSLHPKENDPDKALTHATAMMVQGQYKLTYYFGYEQLGADQERVELYDIQSDPEEMQDLSDRAPDTVAVLLAMLKQKLAEVNKPYL
jgi:arylsulfatase A-like enzyme